MAQDKIMEYLAENNDSWHTMIDIREHIGVKLQNMSRQLRQLVRFKCIECKKTKVYFPQMRCTREIYSFRWKKQDESSNICPSEH